jgi:PBSX family phage terminase large subunit
VAANTSTNYVVVRGAHQDFWRSRDEQVGLSGPAGTGKSRIVLERLNALANKYPNSRHLIVRKTRASCTQSTLVTWEEHVQPNCDVDRMQRNVRDEYRYANGSVVVVGGIDKPTKIMSTEWDTIFIPEAIELNENEFESLDTRLRNGKMPYQQLIFDTNPGPPAHWLKKRANRGQTRMIESRHELNPRMIDARGKLTEYGTAYLGRLDKLTGVRYQRLRQGLWVASEGMVFSSWEPATHVITYNSVAFPLAEIPKHWRRIRVIDFGFTNPFVCLWFAIDPDGRMYLYREWYKTQMIVEDHARKILEIEKEASDGPFEATVCDHDAEDRATLERHLKCRTLAADKTVSPGIQDVESALRDQGDGRAAFFVFADCLVETDTRLSEPDDDQPPRPTSGLEEVGTYVMNPTKDAPVKADDHAMDAWRYAARFVRNRKKTNLMAGLEDFKGQGRRI